MSDALLASYEELPYDSAPIRDAHPEVLAVSGLLMGLRPPGLEGCRVLELGCAAGGNLVPMALALPGATFVGIDLSPRQVAEGQRIVEALGIRNLELEARNILDLDASSGTFDYILCHGVFSWVPGEVREKILSICRESLAPEGIAYVSYNTFPGWHVRGLFRDFLTYGTRGRTDPAEKVVLARGLLEYLAGAVHDPKGLFGQLIANEVGLLRATPDSYLFHDHLEEFNQPLHFSEFAALCGRHGLAFLCEARLSNLGLAEETPRFREALSRLASDGVEREQYLDFLVNRTFRKSLLVREDAPRRSRLAPDVIAGLHVESDVAASDGTGRFRTRDGAECTIRDPLLGAAMAELVASAPGSVPFGELAQRLGVSDAPGPLCRDLLACYMRSLVELRLRPLEISTEAGATPRAYPLARLQAAAGQGRVATPRHAAHDLGEIDRLVLARLDGATSRDDLAAAVAAAVLAGQLELARDGQPLTEPGAVRAAAQELLPSVLQGLAAAGLLVG